MTAPLIDHGWGDPAVQAVYDRLCSDESPPDLALHWAKWKAAQIVNQVLVPAMMKDRERACKLKEHQELLRTALRTAIFEIERRGDEKKLCPSLRAVLAPPNGKAELDN